MKKNPEYGHQRHLRRIIDFQQRAGLSGPTGTVTVPAALERGDRPVGARLPVYEQGIDQQTLTGARGRDVAGAATVLSLLGIDGRALWRVRQRQARQEMIEETAKRRRGIFHWK